MQNWYFQFIVDEKFVKEFFQIAYDLRVLFRMGKKSFIFCGARRLHCGVKV